MGPTVVLKRLAYRLAFRLLQVRWRIAHPDTIGVKCLIADRDRVLLVRHTYGPRVWDVPGGRGRRGEDSLATARREMEEELGLGAAPWRRAGSLRGTLYGRRDLIELVAAELHDPTLRPDPVEIAEVAWFSRDALPDAQSPFLAPILAGIPPAD